MVSDVAAAVNRSTARMKQSTPRPSKAFSAYKRADGWLSRCLLHTAVVVRRFRLKVMVGDRLHVSALESGSTVFPRNVQSGFCLAV